MEYNIKFIFSKVCLFGNRDRFGNRSWLAWLVAPLFVPMMMRANCGIAFRISVLQELKLSESLGWATLNSE